MKRIFGALLMGLVAWAGCSSDLLRYRTKMWHQCQSDLVGQQAKYGRLEAEKRRLARSLGRAEAGLADCRKSGAALERTIADLRKQLALRRAAIAELERQAAQIKARSEMYARLASRLRQMIDAGNLKVTIRKGRMILNLPNEILFDPGRAKLKDAGKKALEQLAGVLREFRDRDFLVAGHTDNVPVHHSRYRSNWELSVARALRVVEFLQKSGMDPHHLAAAGFSEFDPVADNATEEGRAKNRRIEIIVMPKVSELPAIPNPNGTTRTGGQGQARRAGTSSRPGPALPKGPASSSGSGTAPASRPAQAPVPAAPGDGR